MLKYLFFVCTLIPAARSRNLLSLQDVYRNSMPASSFQQQKLRVCEVCSAYLGLHDNDRRLADHFGGKLHIGFIEIREKLDKLRVRAAYFLILLDYRSVVDFSFVSFFICAVF